MNEWTREFRISNARRQWKLSRLEREAELGGKRTDIRGQRKLETMPDSLVSNHSPILPRHVVIQQSSAPHRLRALARSEVSLLNTQPPPPSTMPDTEQVAG